MSIGTQELEVIKQEVAEVRSFYDERIKESVQPLREENERIAGQIRSIQERWKAAEKQAILAQHRSPEQARVPFGKYKGLDMLDLALVRSLLNAQVRQPSGLNPRMLEEWDLALKNAMDSTTGGSGDELVSTQEAAALWMDVNLETMVLSLFSRVDMPTNPFEIPLQLGDVNWYPGAENVSPTATALATSKQTLTAHELVGQVPWSLSLDEDAVIAMAEEVRLSLVRNTAEVIDDLLLNADGATISASDAGKGHWLIGFDGLIHQPLVDNPSQANNHGAGVSDDMFNEVRVKLGRYGARPSDLAYITDPNTYIRALSTENFRTLDKLGPNATLLTGQLGAVEGIPVLVSEQMKLADIDGKVTSGSTGTTGRLLLVNRTQWRVGFRRELSIETERDIQKRQNVMVVSMRLAFAERSGNRATATHTAMQYNITGVA